MFLLFFAFVIKWKFPVGEEQLPRKWPILNYYVLNFLYALFIFFVRPKKTNQKKARFLKGVSQATASFSLSMLERYSTEYSLKFTL
jgi:hypothetical protein